MKSFEDALKLHQQGAISEASTIYQAILKNNPRHADAQHLLGVTFIQQGRFDDAESEIKKALQINSDNADFWINLSQAQKSNGKIQAALESLQSALLKAPEHTQGWNNLGNLQQLRQQHTEAIDSYQRALSLQPDYANAHYNLSISLAKTARLSDAIKHCKKALELEPGKVEYWGQFSNFLIRAGKSAQAKSITIQGLEFHKQNPELLCALASLIEEDGELDQALEIYQRILKQNPDHSLACSQSLYLKRSICDWTHLDAGFEQLTKLIQQQQPYISPFSFLTENSSPQQQLDCANLWCRQWNTVTPVSTSTTPTDTNRKIVIGYVSADFYQHPTAYLAARLFEQHDRNQFKVIAFSNSRDDNSEISRRLKKSFDLFFDIKTMSIDETVELIQQHQVDILVDLKGHTMEAATEIFAYRAAPVQVNYLGYPGTMGASFIDYIIGDKFVTPLESETDFSEKIVQLDCCYQINDSQRPLPETALSKKELGLPDNKFIFGCFNNSWKITPETFDLWIGILKQCPESILWLMDRHPKTSFKSNILKQAKLLGIDPARIYFAKPANYENYLSYYLNMDLFLETIPYNAHTMASDCLWMGCPVLSIKGETFCARVGESILDAVELKSELFFEDIEGYIEAAQVLYSSPEKISKIKKHLISNRLQFSLFDSNSTVLSIEKAYRKMFKKMLANEAAEHIIINKF